MSDTQKNANSSNDETVFDDTRQVGRVKWFNNRAGFGFITMLEGERKVRMFLLIILESV